MQTKHTPAPWIVNELSGQITNTDNTKTIAEINYRLLERYGENNAPLIAAAPELLEALIGMMVEFGGDFENDAILAAHAAIAKATGENNAN